MRFMYLGLVLLVSWKIKNSCSRRPKPGSQSPLKGNSGSGRPIGSNSGSRPGSNLSEKAKVNIGAPNKHVECRKKCLALKAEISDIYKDYPGYKGVQFLYSRCGMVTDGKYGTGLVSPICWCHTPNASNQPRTPVHVCHQGLKITHTLMKITQMKWTSAIFPSRAKTLTTEQEMGSNHWPLNGGEPTVEEVGMLSYPGGGYDEAPRRGPRTPRGRPAIPSSPRLTFKREDDTRSLLGYVLLTDVAIGRERITALIDTGASLTSIHPTFSRGLEEYQGTPLFGANGQLVEVQGVTTIDVWLSRSVKIRLTGLVTEVTDGILLGNDFLSDYAAKIRLIASTMDLTVGPNTVTMDTRWGTAGDIHFNYMMNNGFSLPLYISLIINKAEMTAVIDTGSSITTVSGHLVNKQNIYAANGGTIAVNRALAFFHGKCLIDLQFGSRVLTFPAYVPQSQQTANLIIGNEFNGQYVELIDYQSRSVTIKFPGSVAPSSVIVPFFFWSKLSSRELH